MKKFLSLIAAAALVAGCAAGPAKPMADANTANAAIAAALAATKQASSAGYEWRDTDKLIKDAQMAASKQDYDTAVKLATKAEHQSKNALVQAETQKNAGDRLK